MSGGRRRASPRTSATPAPGAVSRRSSAVPTLPLAPVTATVVPARWSGVSSAMSSPLPGSPGTQPAADRRRRSFGAHDPRRARDPVQQRRRGRPRSAPRTCSASARSDAGGGWLILQLPPAEVAVHPAETSGAAELYLVCDDVEADAPRELLERGLRRGAARSPTPGLAVDLTADPARPGRAAGALQRLARARATRTALRPAEPGRGQRRRPVRCRSRSRGQTSSGPSVGAAARPSARRRSSGWGCRRCSRPRCCWAGTQPAVPAVISTSRCGVAVEQPPPERAQRVHDAVRVLVRRRLSPGLSVYSRTRTRSFSKMTL